MRVEHLAIDGSVVAIEADADLSMDFTAAGWAIVPSLMRTHPFTISPAGHSTVVEETVRGSFPAINVLSTEDYSVKGGNLRVAEVKMPTATGSMRDLTVGAWEGKAGCLSTSLVGLEKKLLVEVFDTLHFREHPRGLAIDSPVTLQPRPPEIIKEVPELGVLNIRPAISSELERLPKSRGHVTHYGELFRIRAQSNALIFVGKSAIVRCDPLEKTDPQEMLAVAQDLQVEWTP